MDDDNSRPISNSVKPIQRRALMRFIDARKQIRYSLLLPAIGLTSTILFCISGLLTSDQIFQSMTEMYGVDPVVGESAARAMRLLFCLIIATSFVIAAANVIISFVWSHRLFGPMVPLREHVRKLRAGHYDTRIHLRRKDEFGELAQELNALAEQLSTLGPIGKKNGDQA